MDNLAHTLIGIGVARSGLSRRYGAGTTLALAVASNVPDVDALWSFFDPWDRFMLRRTHTHALVAAPVIAAALALALRRAYRDRPWKVLFGLCLLGVSLHVLFDLVNSFGVVLLWPFSPRRFELASIFIIDLGIWSIMIAPMAAARFLKSDESRLRGYRVAVGALALYVALCQAGHARAGALAGRELSRANLTPATLEVFPEPLGPHRFRAAARVGGAWRVYLSNVLLGTCELRDVVPTAEESPRLAEVLASEAGRALHRFMAAPVWSVDRDGRALVYDLRFSSLVIRRVPSFRVEFPPGRTDPVVR